MAADQLQRTLDDFRQQLTRGEEAFQRWQSESLRIEADVSERLERLNCRLAKPEPQRQLQLVTSDSASC